MSRNRLIVGYNDLASQRTDLASEWNYEKNGDLIPSMVASGSSKKVWWKCKNGHEWEASISQRVRVGSGCPFCAGVRVLSGYNDLMTTHPELASEWDYEKNGDLRPDMVQAGSEKKVWWICPNGHSYFSWISPRAKRNVGCPVCGRIKSAASYAINRALKNGSLIDTNPDLTSEWNYEKNEKICPEDITANSSKKVWWKCKNGHEWEAVVASRNNGNGCPYCAGKLAIKGETDLLTVNPDLASEWNYEKNEKICPEDVTCSSHKKVWWKCKNGHEWEAVIASRNTGVGCPYCANKKVLVGYNDLATTNPDLASEWVYEKNGDLTPQDVSMGTDRSVWWKCEKGHEWKSLIYSRIKNDCPYCANKKVLVGYNDLATINPELAAEWNYEKNGDLNPEDVLPSIAKKIWWKCENGHEWEAKINNRSQNKGCPYCSGRFAIVGETDLLTVNPDLASEWNYEKNGDLRPENFTSKSGQKVWWKCEKGHEWKSAISDRGNGNGCPICSESHLEKTVRKYLDKYNYEFSEQVKFADLKSKKSLSYDFGLYNNGILHTLIECQGIQHFEPVEFFGGMKQYRKQLEHDKLKKQYCVDNDITLLEIPYTYTDEDIEEMFQR